MSKKIWDNTVLPQGRLLVHIVSAKGLGVEKPTELFVRIEQVRINSDKKSSAKVKEKTKTARKELSPVWNETVYIDVCPNSLTFSLWAPDGMGEKFWGECTKDNLTTLQTEVLAEHTLELSLGSEKTKRTISGQLLVRFIRSTLPSSRSQVPAGLTEYHFWQRRSKKFKNGDLILYSGTGGVHTTTKLEHNLNYSNVGLIVQLPNKWTQVPEFYVLEASENRALILDPISDTRHSGLSLFKLEDRVYNFHGSAIWHLPLAEALDEEQDEIFVRFVKTIHSQSLQRPFPLADLKNPEVVPWKPNVLDYNTERFRFLNELYDVKIREENSVIFSMRGPQLIGLALSALGFIDAADTDVSTWNIPALLAFKCHDLGKIKLLRVLQDCHGFYSSNNSDKTCKTEMATTFKPATVYTDMSTRIPSDKTIANQAKQLNMLQGAIESTVSTQESNLLKAASADLMRQKKRLSTGSNGSNSSK